MVEVFSQGDSRIYTQNQGEYTIAVEVLQADSPEIASLMALRQRVSL